MKQYFSKLTPYIIGVFMVVFAQLATPQPFNLTLDRRFIIALVAVLVCIRVVKVSYGRNLAKNAFLLIAILGTAIALVKPVQYGLDEESHLSHTIGLSDSLVFKYSKEHIRDFDQVNKHDVQRNNENYQGMESWFRAEHKSTKVKGKIAGIDNPSFLPGAIGWNLGRLISKKIFVSYYLGRIFNVLAYALLVFVAIRLSKAYQPMIYFMGVLPSALHVVSGFHYDYLYYGTSLLVISLLTNFLSGQTKITVKYALLFQALSFLFTFTKLPFILVGSLPLVLPDKYYDKSKTRLLSVGMFLLMTVLAFSYIGISTLTPTGNIGVTGQSQGLLYFITHPLPIIRTLLDAPYVIVYDFIASPLHYITHYSTFLMAMNIVIFIIVLFSCSIQCRYDLPLKFQFYSLALFVGIASLVIFAITGDPRVSRPGMIGGVQGRYYYFLITLIPLFVGYWIHKYFKISPLSELEEQRFLSLLQYTLIFLNIFTISVSLYIQL